MTSPWPEGDTCNKEIRRFPMMICYRGGRTVLLDRCHAAWSLAIPDWIKNWSPLNGLDPFSTGRQHYEPVEAERGTTCVWHIGQGCEQILVDWVRSAENALLLFHA
jgi:hypothetical protein